jgi:hypothetical protein
MSLQSALMISSVHLRTILAFLTVCYYKRYIIANAMTGLDELTG